MITTDDDEIAEKCYSFKHFGAKGSSFEIIGTNYKLSNVLSAIGLVQMKKLENIMSEQGYQSGQRGGQQPGTGPVVIDLVSHPGRQFAVTQDAAGQGQLVAGAQFVTLVPVADNNPVPLWNPEIEGPIPGQDFVLKLQHGP